MFRKNVASQKLSFGLVNASTGAALTGATVTARVSIDGAAQASAGGSVTELGNGAYLFSPSQADTNGNSIGFLFTATSAIPVNIHVVTTAADPTDAAGFGLSRLDAAITTRASQTSLDTVDDYVDTEIAAIKAKTDQLTFTASNKVDAALNAAGDLPQACADKVWSTSTRALTDKAGFSLSSAGIQAIWDALTSALTTANSIGKLLVDNVNATVSSRSSHSASDVWAVGTRALTDKAGFALSSAGVQAIWDALTSALSTASSIGKLLVDNVNATISSRLASASYTAPDNSSITAIKAKTDNLPASPAATGDIPTSNITAIKAKTDNLPASPAASGDIPSANTIADAILKRDWTAVTGEASRSMLNAMRYLRNKWSVSGSTLTITKEDDSTSAWTATVTTSEGADPVTGVDPS